MSLRSLAILGVVLFLFTATLNAADWPQWRGPNRSDVSTETGLLPSWPKEGPPLRWTFEEAGIGFAGPAIVGDRLYTMGAIDDKATVFALDTRSGKKLWSVELGPMLQNGYGDGPRGTPTIDGNRLYALTGNGDLACVEITTGAKVWSVNLGKDLGGRKGGWGYTESPLVDGDRVVCSPGGSNGALAALDKNTGKVIWQSKDLKENAAYASIVIAEVNGVRQYVQMTPSGVVGVAAADGKLLWRSSLAANRTAVIPTPIVNDQQVYVSSGYSSGCGLLRLVPDGNGIKAETVYSNKVMTNQHGGVVLVGDHLYGFSDGKGWVCQNFNSGLSVWEEKRGLGKGSVTCAGGKLYCYSEADGTVVLADASPSGWKEYGRFKIARETKLDRKRGRVWTHPVVANGRLYLRDQDLIFCYNIRDEAGQAR